MSNKYYSVTYFCVVTLSDAFCIRDAMQTVKVTSASVAARCSPTSITETNTSNTRAVWTRAIASFHVTSATGMNL